MRAKYSDILTVANPERGSLRVLWEHIRMQVRIKGGYPRDRAIRGYKRRSEGDVQTRGYNDGEGRGGTKGVEATYSFTATARPLTAMGERAAIARNTVERNMLVEHCERVSEGSS
jgi:hypothetical protein